MSKTEDDILKEKYLEGFNEARLTAEGEVWRIYRKSFQHVTRDYREEDRFRDEVLRAIREIKPSWE